MKTPPHVAIALSVLAISFCPAARADLVTNGGFETGDLTGWTLSGDTHDIFVCGTTGQDCDITGFVFYFVPHSGNFALALGPPGSPGTLQQTLPTVAGTAYDISFWVATCTDFLSCDPNSLTVSFGTTTLFTESDLAHSVFTEYTFDGVIASDTNSVLSISGNNQGSYFLIDDISVTPATDGVAATPEPATLVTAGSGLAAALIAVLQRRRRSPTESGW